MMHPLLDRDGYTDDEWALASAERCGWLIATYPSMEHYGVRSDPGSFYRYCAEHDQDAREDSPSTYGR